MTLYLPIAQMSIDVFTLLMLGGVTGVLSGMFGVGGGFLMTPLLIFIGIPPAVAVASMANQIVASSISGFHTHWRKGNVDFRMGGLLLIGGLCGSSLGVWIFSFLKALGHIDLVISIGYVVFLSAIGVTMACESGLTILRKRRQKQRPLPPQETHPTAALSPSQRPSQEVQTVSRIERIYNNPFPSMPLIVSFPRSQLEMSIIVPLLLSALIGVLVSILGIGGGFFMIPAMLYILKMPAAVVVGTSLFQVMFVTANVTMLHAISTQSVDIILAGLLLIGSSVGAQIGSRMGLKLPEEYLRAMLAIIVLGVVLRLGVNLVTTPDNLYSITLSAVGLDG
ncbi:MAG: sulfite exporter TauE/SafE family protein [Sphaerospermopsis sp. SIO1G2]|nr:sulfite exporter TauE/SafE family protein [Sphaerospermopsis sp. SIO1G2]